jgi:hypothetical protein
MDCIYRAQIRHFVSVFQLSTSMLSLSLSLCGFGLKLYFTPQWKACLLPQPYTLYTASFTQVACKWCPKPYPGRLPIFSNPRHCCSNMQLQEQSQKCRGHFSLSLSMNNELGFLECSQRYRRWHRNAVQSG